MSLKKIIPCFYFTNSFYDYAIYPKTMSLEEYKSVSTLKKFQGGNFHQGQKFPFIDVHVTSIKSNPGPLPAYRRIGYASQFGNHGPI